MQLSSLFLMAIAAVSAAPAPAENAIQQTQADEANDAAKDFFCTPWRNYCGSTLLPYGYAVYANSIQQCTPNGKTVNFVVSCTGRCVTWDEYSYCTAA
ncbi:hypothetical protein BLS_002836 [Venturia inaequalis]|uniref:Uncharacterized protein n=1 Tax=Venturia inaequalis TaxID=5025 RepID=A0A8H3YZ72_VENIN|nr:hypothetical protein BLS_002836 [Venturia inaequalis]KAE9975027.1 hypothetical protein EG328_003503 [Venturia inaequalis]KAE9989841.1 hypothetical protein EG327_002182 [Venturia inaequalis]RDI87623.1 26S proteasome regulatory subunit [Venturia inaequalis]